MTRMKRIGPLGPRHLLVALAIAVFGPILMRSGFLALGEPWSDIARQASGVTFAVAALIDEAR